MCGVVANASNMRSGKNPPYNRVDFLLLFPQFSDIPDAVVEHFIELAASSIRYNRWFDAWRTGMGLFVAHWCTLWLQAQPGDDEDAAAAGLASGTVASQSVGAVSVSFDNSSINSDLGSWGAYKQTAFGQQFATMATMYGKGGMYVR